MMRCGEPLGTLDYTTDKIYLMRSTHSKKLAEDKDYINNIKKGIYIK